MIQWPPKATLHMNFSALANKISTAFSLKVWGFFINKIDKCNLVQHTCKYALNIKIDFWGQYVCHCLTTIFINNWTDSIGAPGITLNPIHLSIDKNN